MFMLGHMTVEKTDKLVGFQTLQAFVFSVSSCKSPTHIHMLSSLKPLNISEECNSSHL